MRKAKKIAQTDLMDSLLKQAEKIQAELVAQRRWLHQNAETGFALKDTFSFIESELKKMGCTPKRCGKAGLTATIGQGDKCVLLRADADALPIKEETGLPFACKNGNMHACGHDLHTAMLLGAVKLLKAREERLNGVVKVFFQSAEEILEGAKEGIEEGILQNPKVDVALMVHTLTGVELPTGTLVVASAGVSAPAADYFSVQIKGKGCHGSAPWKGVDALTVAGHTLIALQEISARELSIANPAVLTVGSLQSGEAGNVFSDRASLHGTLRAFDERVREKVKMRVEEISKNVAKAFRAKAKTVYGGGCPTLVNDERLSAFATKTLTALLGKERTFTSQTLGGDVRENSGGSEDFAYIAHRVPSVMVAVASGERKDGYEFPLHHPKAKFDESALCIGSAVYAQVASEWLKEVKKDGAL